MRYIQQLFMLALMAVLMVSCKNIEDVHRNEYSASIGTEGLPSSHCELGETNKSINDNASNKIVISGSYEHHLTNWLYVGISASYFHRSYDVWEADISRNDHGWAMSKRYRQVGNNSIYDIAILPTMKFNWFRKKYCTIYSRLSAGCVYHHENLTVQKDVDYLEDETWGRTSFQYQVSPLGLEVGSLHFRLFGELGLGATGFQAGIRIRY